MGNFDLFSIFDKSEEEVKNVETKEVKTSSNEKKVIEEVANDSNSSEVKEIQEDTTVEKKSEETDGGPDKIEGNIEEGKEDKTLVENSTELNNSSDEISTEKNEEENLSFFEADPKFKEKAKEKKEEKKKKGQVKTKTDEEKVYDQLKKYSKVIVSVYGVNQMIFEGKDKVEKIDLKEIENSLIKIKFREFSNNLKWNVVATCEEGECYLLPISNHFYQKG